MATRARSKMENILVFGGTTEDRGGLSEVTWFLKENWLQNDFQQFLPNGERRINHWHRLVVPEGRFNHWHSLVLSFLLNFGDCSLACFSSHNFAQLLLSDCIVRVWDQILPDLGQCEGDSGVALGRWPDRWDFDVQVVVEVRIFGISSLSQFLFLKILILIFPVSFHTRCQATHSLPVFHRAASQDCHLAQRLLLQPPHRISTRTKQLSNEIKLRVLLDRHNYFHDDSDLLLAIDVDVPVVPKRFSTRLCILDFYFSRRKQQENIVQSKIDNLRKSFGEILAGLRSNTLVEESRCVWFAVQLVPFLN